MIDRLSQYASLLKKVVQHTPQIFDPERRRDLVEKFWTQKGSVDTVVPTDMNEVLVEMRNFLKSKVLPDGTEVFSSVNSENRWVYLAATLFPKNAILTYLPNIEPKSLNGQSKNQYHALTAGTTRKYEKKTYTILPDQGYRDGDGNYVDFQERSWRSRIQHGGFVISNQVEIYPYGEFLKKRDMKLSKGEYVIEANWYMNSENAKQVVGRKNMRLHRRPYNVIGYLYLKDGSKQLFTVTGAYEAKHLQREVSKDEIDRIERINEVDPVFPSAIEIAAMCKLLATQIGAVRWEVAGLEFFGGGTYLPKRYSYAQERDYFAVSIGSRNITPIVTPTNRN